VSLRWKISLVVLTAVIGLVSAILIISQITFSRDFQNVENQRAVEMAQRADCALSEKINSIDTINIDYAAWDDTYNFITDPRNHQDFITGNFIDSTFVNTGINYVLIYNNGGNCEYSRGYDLIDNTGMPVPGSLFNFLSAGNLLRHPSIDDSSRGIISLPEGQLLVSAQPIVHSNEQGPVAGTMIMARNLDSQIVAGINDLVLLPVTMVSVKDARSELSDVTYSDLLASSASSAIMNSSQIAGYYMVNDISGNPAFMLKLEMPRDIYNRGIVTTRYFVISLLVLGGLFLVGINLFFSKTVTSRVNRVGSYLDTINVKGDLSKRLSLSGKDEISHLSQVMNTLVQALQDSRTALDKKEQTENIYRQMIESAIHGFVFTDTTGIIFDLNDARVRLHGYADKRELIGTRIFDLVPPEDRLQAIDNLEESFETGRVIYSRYCMLKKDGTKFLVENYVKAVKDAGNKPSGFIITTLAIDKDNSIGSDTVTEMISVSNE
jgi:PAS domain S-box-containing protein